jgi:serine/threonine-protein kinase
VAAFATALAPFAPARSQPVVAAIQRIDAGQRVSDSESLEPAGLAHAATEASDGDSVPARVNRPATTAGVSSTSSPSKRRSPWAVAAGIGALALLGGGGLLAARRQAGTVGVAVVSPSALPPPSAQGGGSASTDPSPSASASVPGAASSPASASRRVFLVIEPPDAMVEIDGVKTEPHKGVVDLEGAPGSVHVVILTKDKSHTRGDVVITEAGAMPPKLELVMPKVAAPAKPPGKAPRFGFDE